MATKPSRHDVGEGSGQPAGLDRTAPARGDGTSVGKSPVAVGRVSDLLPDWSYNSSTPAADDLRALESDQVRGPGTDSDTATRSGADQSTLIPFSLLEIEELRAQGDVSPWAQVLISAAFGHQLVTAAELERVYAECLLWKYTRRKTARILGWDESTLRRKIHEWDRDRPIARQSRNR